MLVFVFFFFFKQKTAYELRISDWSSDVCSSDLFGALDDLSAAEVAAMAPRPGEASLCTRMRDGSEVVIGKQQTRDKLQALFDRLDGDGRSEERRVGKECVSTCRSRWPP